MALIEITPPAGIVKIGTDYANKGRFVDGDLVRFENGYLKPLGGWTLFRQNPVGTFFSATVTTTASSSTLTITTSTAHGLLASAKIFLEDFVATGGLTAAQINGEYTIATVPSTTTLTITSSGTATATDTSASARII